MTQFSISLVWNMSVKWSPTSEENWGANKSQTQWHLVLFGDFSVSCSLYWKKLCSRHWAALHFFQALSFKAIRTFLYYRNKRRWKYNFFSIQNPLLFIALLGQHSASENFVCLLKIKRITFPSIFYSPNPRSLKLELVIINLPLGLKKK